MSLDITVYGELKFANKIRRKEIDFEELLFIVKNKDFTQQTDNVIEGAYESQVAYSFNAGAYSSYNDWRDQLCLVFYDKTITELIKLKYTVQKMRKYFIENSRMYNESPFLDLLVFSDCEGFIDSVTSKYLFFDFEKYREFVREHVMFLGQKKKFKDSYLISFDIFVDLYDKFLCAFFLSSNDGIISFG